MKRLQAKSLVERISKKWATKKKSNVASLVSWGLKEPSHHKISRKTNRVRVDREAGRLERKKKRERRDFMRGGTT